MLYKTCYICVNDQCPIFKATPTYEAHLVFLCRNLWLFRGQREPVNRTFLFFYLLKFQWNVLSEARMRMIPGSVIDDCVNQEKWNQLCSLSGGGCEFEKGLSPFNNSWCNVIHRRWQKKAKAKYGTKWRETTCDEWKINTILPQVEKILKNRS